MDVPTCAICSEILCQPVRMPCGHAFDRFCMQTWFNQQLTCPSCRQTCQPELPEIDSELLKNLESEHQVAFEIRMQEMTALAQKQWEEERAFALCRCDNHAQMVRQLRGAPGLRSESICEALLCFPRSDFLPPSVRDGAYQIRVYSPTTMRRHRL
mmetsp:Transcript_2272/g.4607  ORF Transcript_2272/g.4607 Transcript_2272/m.4607 type:complete len:155 (+) Transcript_2272:186-650(+)